MLVPGALSLGAFAWLLTLHPFQNAGRVYAAYGGVYIVASLLWKMGMVECTRHGTWMIYSLPSKPPVELQANLKCLQDCAPTDKRFRADLKALQKVRTDCRWIGEALENKRACNC